MSPARVRQSRRKGASIGDAVSVAAPSRWANPYRHVRPRSVAVALYRDLHLPSRPDLDPRAARRDLACYCPPDQPCHADVLLKLGLPVPEPYVITHGGPRPPHHPPPSCPEDSDA